MISGTQALSVALLHFVWQGAMAAVVLWISLFVLRRRSANARYIASCAVLAVLTALPVLTAYVVYLSPTPTGAAAARVDAAPGVAIATGDAATSATTDAWLRSIEKWALPVWSLGVLLFSMRLLFGFRQVSALRRNGEPAPGDMLRTITSLARRMGIAKPIQVLMSTIAECPSVVGCLRPVILLPAATVLGLNPQQLEAILAHELAHIRRYDYLVNAVQMLVETLFFYHPAVWWVSRRIRIERELCCDDVAVQSCGDALCYARALTALEKLRVAAPAMAMGSRNGPLFDRIQRLVGAHTAEHRPSRLPGVLAICAGLICVALNVNWVHGQVPAERPPKQTPAPQTPDSPGVKVDLGNSAIIHRTAVVYPEAAQKKGVHGALQVEVHLDPSGDVSDARVLSGPEELRKAALQSVLNWHFTSDAASGVRLVTIDFQTPPPGSASWHTEDAVPDGIVLKKLVIEHSDGNHGAVVMEGPEGRVEAAELRVEGPGPLFAWHTSSEEAKGQAVVSTHQFLEEELKALKQLEQSKSTASKEEWMRLQRQIDELKKKLEASRADVTIALGSRSVTGRTLKSINTSQLSDDVRNDLLSRLPVHEGDTLTTESLEAIAKAVRAFDEHLEANFAPAGDGAAEMRIFVRNGGKVLR